MSLNRALGVINKSGGEAGIRTLGSCLRNASLAVRYFRPLSHLSNNYQPSFEYKICQTHKKIFLGFQIFAYKTTFAPPAELEAVPEFVDEDDL